MRKYAFVAGPVLLVTVVGLFFQNCSPAFKIDDHPDFHGNGGLNIPNDPVVIATWGENEVLSPNTDGVAPKVTDFTGSSFSGNSYFIPNTQLSATGVKFEIRPVGGVSGAFSEEPGRDSLGNSIQGLTYRAPISFSGREVFDVVAVDAQGDKSIKGKITINVSQNPLAIEVEDTVIEDDRKAYKFGVFAPGSGHSRKLRVKNVGTQPLMRSALSCSNTGFNLGFDAALHPAPGPTQIAAGGTFNYIVLFQSANKMGVVDGNCTLSFTSGSTTISRTVNFSALAVTGNLNPDFSPLQIKVNLVSLRNSAGAVAGNQAMHDKILNFLNRDFVFGGVKPITFVKGTYSVITNANYDLKQNESAKSLLMEITPGEITYFVGRAFNTAALGEAVINSSLHRGIPVAISVNGVDQYDGGVISHELGHVMNLYHTAEASPSKTSHTLTMGERDFCKFPAGESTYAVTTVAAASAASKKNLMFYSVGSNYKKDVESFSTGTYATPMLNLVNCWKAINRIQF